MSGLEHEWYLDEHKMFCGPPRLPLDRTALAGLLADPTAFTGLAGAQVAAFGEAVAAVVARHPEAAAYQPGGIL